MTDYHVHIGQFKNAYYYADRVFSALKSVGFDEAWFSSTTSCVYCKESSAAKADKRIYANAPTARELFENILYEIQEALKAAKEIGVKARMLYWVVPDIHLSDGSGISIEYAMNSADYSGFKIHTRAQNWDFNDARIFKLAEDIFSFAEKYAKLILIHCDDDHSPRLFEHFIAGHPKALIQIAHLRPISDTIYMLSHYSNVVADTSMASRENVEKIEKAGFSNKLRYGTDFPITHWHSCKPDYDPSVNELVQNVQQLYAMVKR